MMEHKINKGIPIPAKSLSRIKYHFQDMKVDDSFAIPVTDETKDRIRHNIASSATQWVKRKGNGVRFTTRVRLNNENELEVRIWRTR